MSRASIGSVVPGSPAEKAGLMRGDRIITVAGDTSTTWKDLSSRSASGGRTVT